MHQVSVCPATAVRRSQWHALRPVLILGGFIAIWWALMTGVAHAESTPHHSLVDQVGSQLKVQHHSSHPVREVIRRVHHDVRTTTSTKVGHQVAETTETTAPVTRSVSTVTDSTPLAPVTTKVIKTVHTALSQTVEGTVQNPVLDTATGTVGTLESSTVQGDSHSQHHAMKALPSSLSELLSPTTVQQSGSSTAPDRNRASTHIGGPLNDPQNGPLNGPLNGTPTLLDPCSSPSGSGSSPYTPVGITESSTLMVPTVLRDHHTWSLARPHGGPADKPSSSPD
jgi:hypothetical protein